MIRPKISIQKKFILDARGHYRFYAPTYNQKLRKKGSPVIVSLDPRTQYHWKTGEPYPIANIRTEKQLVLLLLNNWGYGEYMITAHLKGREGLFIFWRGELTESGWLFQAKEYDKREIVQLEKDLNKADTEDEKRFIEDEIGDWKSLNKEFNKAKRYGFHPFLRSSGRRGEWHAWDEPDEAVENTFQELNKKSYIKGREMTLDEMNGF